MQTGYRTLKVGVFLWSLIAGFELMAQKNDSTASIQEFALTATNFEERQMFDSAVFYHHKVADLYYRYDQLYEYINSYNNIADIYIKQNRFKEAIKWLDSAYHKPVSSFRNEDERLALLEWHLFKAYALEQSGDLVSARTVYEAAKLKLVNIGNFEDFYVGKFLYRPLGNIYAILGHENEAIWHLRRFKEISVEYGDHNAVALAVIDLGAIYRKLEYWQLAVEEYNFALTLSKLSEATIGSIKINLAAANYELKKLSPALTNALEATEIFNNIVNQGDTTARNLSHLSKASSLLGIIYTARKQFSEANKHFQKSLALVQLANGTIRRHEVAHIYNGIGNFFLAQNKPQPSLEYFHKALKSLIPDIDENDHKKNPDVAELYLHNTIFESLVGKFRSYKMYYNQLSEAEYLNLALSTYELVLTMENRLRVNFQREHSMLLQKAESRLRNEEALEVVYQLSEINEDSLYIEKAFRIMENHKASILLEGVKHLKAKHFANIPNWLLNKEQQLKAMKSFCQKQVHSHKIAYDGDSTAIKEIMTDMHHVENELMAIEKRLKEEFPNYYQLKKMHTRLPNATDITKLLEEKNSDFIAYFVGRKAIYSLHLTEHKSELIKIEKDAAFEDLVLKLINMARGVEIESQSPEGFGKLAKQLYQKLIKPLNIDQRTKQLLIIPDGILEHLSFEFLASNNEFKKLTYNNLNYMIKDYTLRYAFSASTLIPDYDQLYRREGKKPFLGIAPFYNEDNQSAESPIGKFEMTGIQTRLGGDILFGEQATKAKFKSLATDYRILHLTSPSGINDSLPILSWLTFYDKSTKNQDHYRLYYSDLFGLKMDAELIVLSAYETGANNISGAKNLMSLNTAFSYAGCPGKVITLWKTKQGATATIMEAFYRHLQKGETKATALRNAKLRYLKNGLANDNDAHPFYWAAGLTYGNNNPVFQKNNYTMLVWILIPFLILGIVFMMYVKKR